MQYTNVAKLLLLQHATSYNACHLLAALHTFPPLLITDTIFTFLALSSAY